MFSRVKIREQERGLLFDYGELKAVLGPGDHFVFGAGKTVVKSSVLKPWIEHPDLVALIKSGKLGSEVTLLDIKDRERVLVSLDGRLARLLGPGQLALWHCAVAVKTEPLDTSRARFEHADLPMILALADASAHLTKIKVEPGWVCHFYVDGVLRETLPPGTYAHWRHLGDVTLVPVDLREQTLDVAGQEILTADKVSLRLNAVVTFKVADPVRATTVSNDVKQALYRDVQLALRAVIGTRELDPLLADKESVTTELKNLASTRAAEMGLQLIAFGIRDIILPGEMRELFNKVTEARKAAEAALITRREETAAARSQANTAKILESSPVLLRLREIEALEKIAEKANLTVVTGEGGLAEKVVKLI
jgi:regulator of protease activity HflC (stomatin/prohibitin superfamily)